MTPSSTPSPFASGGRRVGPYELRAALGKGAQGGVFLGHDLVHDRPVAVKVLHAASGPTLARFEREVEAIARLQHPGIVPLVDRGRMPDGRPYLVMAYTPGRSLGKLMEGLPPTDALRIVRDVARAVHHAHGLGILHRDLKPENILVGDDGGVRILDFGLAYIEDLGRLTRSGSMLGTAAYMPPEQATGAALDARADVFALGATLYHALTGEAPLAGDLPPALAPLHRREVEPPSSLAPGLPAGVDAVVLRAMAFDVADRHPSADALADDLERLLSGPIPPPAARPSRRRAGGRPARRALVGLALLLVTIGAVTLALRATSSPARGPTPVATSRPDPTPTTTAPEPPAPPSTATPAPAPALGPPSDEPLVAPAAPDPALALRQGAPLRLVDAWGGWRARHLSMVSGVAVARRRGLVASAGIDGEVGLWDARDGSLLRRFMVEGQVWQVRFTADDAGVVVCTEPGVVHVWDAATGLSRRTFVAHAGGGCVDVSPDGRWLATSGHDGSFAVWRLEGDDDLPERRLTHRAPDGVGGCTAVWADDDRLVSIGEDGVVRLWSREGAALAALPVAEGRVAPRRYWSRERAGPTGLWSVAARGDRAVVADVTGQVLLVDLTGPRVVWERRLIAEDGVIRHVTLTPDGRRVVASGDDGRIHVLDAASGDEVARLAGHSSWVAGTVADASDRLYSCGNDGTVRRWDPDGAGSWRLTWPTDGHLGAVTALAWLALPGGADGCVASSSAFDPRIRLSHPGGRETTVDDGRALALAVVEGRADGQRLMAAIETVEGTFLASWSVEREARGLALGDPLNSKASGPVLGLARAAPRTIAVALSTGEVTLMRLEPPERPASRRSRPRSAPWP